MATVDSQQFHTTQPSFPEKQPQLVDEKIVKYCKNCKITNIQLLRCSRCKKVYYCGIQCQKVDWSNHKKQCKLVKDQTSNEKEQDDTKESIENKQSNKQNTKIQKQKQEGLNQFGKLTHIGAGNFSIIYKTQCKKDGKKYAIKQVQKAKVQRLRKQADIFMQKHCLNKLKDCPYVVRLYKTFQDQISLYFQMQFPQKGQIWQVSKIFGIIPNYLYKYYVSYIVKAIAILHNTYQIVHRDLKPQNILLDAQNKIKLIDFGTAKDLERPDIKGAGNGLKGKKQFQNYVGTAHYMAPQCIHNKASEKKSDIYSLSGVFYFLKVGSPPFQGGSQYLTFTKSLQNQLFTCPQLFDQNLQDLIKKMNFKDMQKRIDINQVMSHQYFEEIDFQNLQNYNQDTKNITAQQSHLVQLTVKLTKILQNQKQPNIKRRKQIYEKQIKQILSQQKQKTTNEKLIKRLQIIDIQCQTYLNIRDNTDISFTEIYKQIKGIPDLKAQKIYYKKKKCMEQKNSDQQQENFKQSQ